MKRTVLASALAATTTPLLAQNLALEEVIVTATKRATTIQEISGTVNVVTGESLEKFNALAFGDIEQQTAGLSLISPNARNSTIAMRGISLDPEAGASGVVSVFWNDQVIRTDVAFSQLYDMERVEVLRGPQGTLQGRTSPGGAINLITRGADTSVSDGYVEATFGDNDGINTQVAWGGPIIEDVLGVRIAAVYDQNNSNDVENITTGLDDPESEAKSARISGKWQITDNLSSSLVYQYFDRDIEDPKGMSGSDSLGIRPTLDAEDKIALGKTNDFGELDYDLYNLKFDWSLGELDLVSITGWTDSKKFSGTQNDRANYVTDPQSLTNQTALTDVNTFSQEFRLSSLDNDFWDWMVGVFYLDQETRTEFVSHRSVANGPNPITGDVSGISFSSFGAIPVDRKEWALFTHNTFYLTDATSLEVGLRYTDYDSFRRADVFYGGLNYVPAFYPEFLVPIIEEQLEASFPIEGVSDDFQSTEEDAVTGSLTLRYEWSDATTVYAAYNRGYRPSGISINPTPSVQFLPNGEADLVHDEETSDSVEIGFKGRYLDGRGTLNGAVYYQQFDGYFGFVRGVQVLNDLGEPEDISGGLIHNGDASIWGVELEGQFLISENWVAGGAFSYTKGEWDDGAEAPCNDRESGEILGFCDIGGENLGGEPELTVSLNTEFVMPFTATEWYIRGLYKFTDDRDNTDASAGIGITRGSFESNQVLNLYTGLRSSDSTWDLSLWAKNLFDSDEVTYEQGPDQYDLEASGGSYTQSNIQAERTIGITARYNF
ncbi:TonB-dependent receptor [Seongchinamella unica]|uniref:TonB-dependent receptor n=1 Tax=Seongchinamella unica TaxID=2547392 RepID=UPI001EEE30A8|nr:TonB-dependent receptor [Seongchinamella unica]